MPSILRVHLRSPLTTALAVLAVGLGVGANTALFSAVRAVLLRPLPYAEPERLVTIWDANEAKGLERQRLAPARVGDWQQAREVFADVAAHDTFDVSLSGLGEPDRVRMTRATANLFSLAGVVPVRGRLLTPDDEGPQAAPVALVSHGLAAPAGRRAHRGPGAAPRPASRGFPDELPVERGLDAEDVEHLEHEPRLAHLQQGFVARRIHRGRHELGRLARGTRLCGAHARIE